MIVPCQWHIQLKQHRIGVLGPTVPCPIISVNKEQPWRLEYVLERLSGGLNMLRLPRVPLRLHFLCLFQPMTGSVSTVLKFALAKKAYGCGIRWQLSQSTDSWLELRVASWTGLVAVGLAVRYGRHYWPADVTFHAGSSCIWQISSTAA